MESILYKKKLLDKHLNLVIKKSKEFNLTSILDIKRAQILHIEDSLLAINELHSSPEGLMVDIGSGAGYPGIPLAVYSERKTTLCERTKKKSNFLFEVVETLGLNNRINIYHGRTEELSLKSPNEFSVVVARALAPLPSLLELASPLLKEGGIFIAYKSLNYKEELDKSKQSLYLCGFELNSIRETNLSNNIPRVILTFRKISPKIKLPRKLGIAQKKPII